MFLFIYNHHKPPPFNESIINLQQIETPVTQTLYH
jgi:hypothetical protein